MERRNIKTTLVECPICEKSDQIQKVSSIYASGSSRTIGISRTSGVSNITGDQTHYNSDRKHVGNSDVAGIAHSTSKTSIQSLEQTSLAKTLAPPLEPIKPQKPLIGIFDGVDKLKFFVSLVGGIIPGLFLADFIFFQIYINDFVNSVLMLGVITFFAWLTNKYFKKFVRGNNPYVSVEKRKNEEYKNQVRRFEINYAVWEAKHIQWKKAYYCHRDDVVFLPYKSNAVEPGNINALLSQE